MSERTVCNRTSSHTNGGSMKGPAGIGGLNPAAQEFVPKQAVSKFVFQDRIACLSCFLLFSLACPMDVY